MKILNNIKKFFLQRKINKRYNDLLFLTNDYMQEKDFLPSITSFIVYDGTNDYDILKVMHNYCKVMNNNLYIIKPNYSFNTEYVELEPGTSIILFEPVNGQTEYLLASLDESVHSIFNRYTKICEKFIM